MNRFIDIVENLIVCKRIPVKNSESELLDVIDSPGDDIIGTILKIRGVGFLEIDNVTIDDYEFVFVCKLLIRGVN